jgi:ubiquinone/menaquinone biosynthesis C-methylase UbiE
VSFDPLAPWYQTLERIAFGNDLQRCRVACLGEIATPQRVLIVGEGDGRFLCELLRLHPGIEVDCLDESRRMLQLARERIERELPEYTGCVRFLHQDIRSWDAPEQHYDLLVTHFVLDCFPEAALPGLIKKLAGAVTDDASWLLADFCLPPNGMARLRVRAWLATMYLFFRITARIRATELVDPTPFMQGEGFAVARQHLFRQGMLKSEIWRRSATSLRGGWLDDNSPAFQRWAWVVQEMSPAQGRKEQRDCPRREHNDSSVPDGTCFLV